MNCGEPQQSFFCIALLPPRDSRREGSQLFSNLAIRGPLIQHQQYAHSLRRTRRKVALPQIRVEFGSFARVRCKTSIVAINKWRIETATRYSGTPH